MPESKERPPQEEQQAGRRAEASRVEAHEAAEPPEWETMSPEDKLQNIFERWSAQSYELKLREIKSLDQEWESAQTLDARWDMLRRWHSLGEVFAVERGEFLARIGEQFGTASNREDVYRVVYGLRLPPIHDRLSHLLEAQKKQDREACMVLAKDLLQQARDDDALFRETVPEIQRLRKEIDTLGKKLNRKLVFERGRKERRLNDLKEELEKLRKVLHDVQDRWRSVSWENPQALPIKNFDDARARIAKQTSANAQSVGGGVPGTYADDISFRMYFSTEFKKFEHLLGGIHLSI